MMNEGVLEDGLCGGYRNGRSNGGGRLALLLGAGVYGWSIV